ncbi:radial spoke head protein 9 homolog [Clavelina lepadiformis]|uniref:Radial spoke head protein 9 homolog n=1 Tax=Clavelina lepadiformis TaxID=159417 RepID=A0ABP0GPS6_CLALP
MDAEGLHLSLDYLSGSGVILSPEKKAALQTSLIILKTHYKFQRVVLWGKILGIKDDYFIAQGAGRDELTDRKTLYSLNCIDWHLLPPATSAMKEKGALVRGRLMGDPSYEYEHTDVRRVRDGDEYTEEEVTIQIKEEDRIAAVVATIDEEASIVPRGAYIKTPLGEVHANRSFEGLPVTESGKLNSYMHFRAAQKLASKSIKEKADLDPSIDFMDTIEDDIPKGSWSLQFERGSGLVCLRSLLWLGLTFYHVPNTTKYGCLYIGTGEKNLDVPFML